MLYQLTNFGQPFIYVEDGNFENRGELLLRHQHDGTDLRLDYARDTLQNLSRVWKRPVCVLTRVEGDELVFTVPPLVYAARRRRLPVLHVLANIPIACSPARPRYSTALLTLSLRLK